MVAVNAATSFEVNGEVRVGAIVRRDKAKAGFAFRTDEAFFFSAFFRETRPYLLENQAVLYQFSAF